MIRTPTRINGVWVIDLEPVVDGRGFFARSWCAERAREWGLTPTFAQTSVSFNERAGTLRGMHWQDAPHGEAKLVRCTAGAIFDVALDLRPDSPSYLRWEAFDLSSGNRRQLFLPEGVAHGFQTLESGCEVLYHISAPFVGESARGVRWDDPAFSIAWPRVDERVISERDASYPDFRP